MIKRAVGTVVLALMVCLPMSVSASGDDGAVGKVMIILSSSSPQTQGMAMVLGNTMAQEGAEVEVLLCDAAGDLALANQDGDTALEPKKVTPAQMLNGLVEKGASVSVCALYLPNSEYRESDLADGVSVAKPSQMTAVMRDP
ncbi:MAG: hypothetical protein R6W87_05695 [Halospina sp.]